MADLSKLTEKQKLFAKYYIENGKQNQTDAAKRAGYAEKSAHIEASRMMKHPTIQEYIGTLSLSIEEIFQAEAKNMLINLIEIAQSRKASPSARVRASVEVLDRAGYAGTLNVKGNLNVAHSGNVTTTEQKEIHIIQQLVNGNDEVADAILQAMQERNRVAAIPEDVEEQEEEAKT